MTPPKGVAPASSAAPISPDPKAPEAPPGKTTYNQVEIHAGVRTGANDTFQGNAGVAYFPMPGLSLGLDLLSNFSSKPITALFKPGYRFRLNEYFSIQPTAVVGGGALNDYGVVGGRLAEKATLSGGFWALGSEVQFQFNPTRSLGFYIAPGYLHEGYGDTSASPSTFTVSKEDPRRSNDAFTISIGGTFGTAPKPYQSSSEDKKEEFTTGGEKPAVEDPKIAEMKIDQRVNARVAAIKEGLEKDKAEKFEGAIGKMRTRITRAKTHLGHVTAGINRTNQMGKSFEESLDTLARNPKKPLGSDKKDAVKANITALITATDLQKVDASNESEDIRTGLQFVYPLSTSKNRYGFRILRQLKNLRDQLKAHKENDLAEMADQAVVKLQKYLDEKPDTILMEDLKTELTSIQSNTGSLEAMGTEYNLSDNISWMALKADLRTLKDDVAFMTRQADALSSFAAIFNGSTNFYGDQVDTADRAKSTMETALQFLADMPKTDRYKDITLEGLKKTYSDYINFLVYQTSIFIEIHTPPQEKNLAKRREWFASMEKARDLICQIDPSQTICAKPLEQPPKANPKPQGKAAEKPAAKPADKPAPKPADKPADKPVEKPTPKAPKDKDTLPDLPLDDDAKGGSLPPIPKK